MDEMDKRLVGMLREDARASISQLADRLGHFLVADAQRQLVEVLDDLFEAGTFGLEVGVDELHNGSWFCWSISFLDALIGNKVLQDQQTNSTNSTNRPNSTNSPFLGAAAGAKEGLRAPLVHRGAASH